MRGSQKWTPFCQKDMENVPIWFMFLTDCQVDNKKKWDV